MIKINGIVYSIISAFIFGLTPIYMKLVSAQGLNMITYIFYSSILTAIICVVYSKLSHTSLVLKGKKLKEACISGVTGGGLTTVLLGISYNYLPSGMATSLHFIYPTIVMIISVIIFKDHINILRSVSLFMCLFAIIILGRSNSTNKAIGVVIALCSGFTYAFYIVYIEKTCVKEFPWLLLVFYMSLGGFITSFLFGVFTKTITFIVLDYKLLAVLTITTLFRSFIATPFFQLGVRYSGSTIASLLSTFEPLTSIIFGYFILNEKLNTAKVIGCIAIILSVILIIADAVRINSKNHKYSISNTAYRKL